MRVPTDGQTHTQTDRHTDANRFYNLSHAICYSYGTDNETGCHIACEESLSNRIWQIFLIGTVHYAEGLRRMRRHGPVIVHCTDLEDFPRIHIVDHLYAPTEELTECSLLSTDMNYNSHSSYICLQ